MFLVKPDVKRSLVDLYGMDGQVEIEEFVKTIPENSAHDDVYGKLLEMLIKQQGYQ